MPLVKLFAGVLRKDADGKHYLVTPVEKVDVAVADAPFLAVEMEVQGSGREQTLVFRTNVDDVVTAGPEHPIRFAVEPGSQGLKPYLHVRGRLEALVTRALYYDLVELAVDDGQRPRPVERRRILRHARRLNGANHKKERAMLKDPPILTIRREFKRPPRELIAKLAGAQTGHIVDALQGRGALDHHVKPADPERASFVGPALTCECGANDNLAIMAALVIAQPGDVIIASCDGFAATAGVGDNLAMMAKNKGVAAVVTDGMARDRDGIVAAGLPVFARGITPNSCVRSGPGKLGFAIVCGGVAVEPGDVVLGDRDGVVVIPQAQLEAVVAALADIRRMEDETQKKIRAGMSHLDSVAELLKSDRVAYVD